MSETDDGFIDILPADKAGPAHAGCVLAGVALGSRKVQRLSINFRRAALDDETAAVIWAANHFSLAWNPAQKALRLTVADPGAFEFLDPARGKGATRIARFPLPAGLMFAAARIAVQPDTNAARRTVIIDVPRDFWPAAPVMVAKPAPLPAPRRDDVPLDDPLVVRAALGLPDENAVPREIDGVRLSPVEAIILGLLARRQLVTRATIMMATADPEKPEDTRDPKLADVLLSKMRPKLAQLGLEVRLTFGEGWGLPQQQRQKLQRLIAGAREAA